MRETAMMQMLDFIPRHMTDLIKQCEQLLIIERKQLIEAFDTSTKAEVLNTQHFINGEEYYEKTYNTDY